MDTLRFITCGSVDDGKSTLIGRLLYETKLIFEDQLEALKADSKKFGTQGERFDFALLVDGLQAEREQKITISGGSALSKEEIERMVKDAEAHAEEDKVRREETETRNMGESLVFSTEKFLSESGDKVSPEHRTPVDEALSALKDAIKPDSGASKDDIQAKIDTLHTKSQEMGAAMYAAAAEQGESADVPGAESTDGGQPATDAGDDDVVDAEVVDDDEVKDAK